MAWLQKAWTFLATQETHLPPHDEVIEEEREVADLLDIRERVWEMAGHEPLLPEERVPDEHQHLRVWPVLAKLLQRIETLERQKAGKP